MAVRSCTFFALLAVFAAGVVRGAPLPGEDAMAQLDRAEALIAQQDAAGRSAFALLGVLTESDRAALTGAIAEAAELTDAASVAIDSAIEAIDEMTEPEDATADRRFALAIERRELRLPLARARAATILAALQDDPRTRTALATTAVNALHKVTLSGVAIDTRGAIIAGEALLLLDEPIKALASFDAAIERAGGATGADQPSPMDLAEAMIGRALAIGGTDGDRAARLALSDCHTEAPFVAGGVVNPLLSLLRADAQVNLDRLAGTAPIGIDGYLDAMGSAPTETVYLALRGAVFGRLDRLWEDEAWTPASAPALALVARSRRLAEDESKKTTAIHTLERLLKRSDEPIALEIAEARFALAGIMAPEDKRGAMLLYLGIASAKETSRLAPTALRKAYAIGDAVEHRDLGDSVTALFDRTIALMIKQAVSAAQREALWLRRASLFESVGDDVKAIAAYDKVPGESSVYFRAQRRAVSLAVGMLLRAPDREQALALLRRAEAHNGQPIEDAVRELPGASAVLALTELGRLDEAVRVIENLSQFASGSSELATLAIDGCLAPLRAQILDAELRGDAGAQRAAAELLLRVVGSDRARAMTHTRDRREAEGFALLFAGRPEEALPIYQYLLEERFDFRFNTWRAEAFHQSGNERSAFGLYRSVTEILESRGQTDDPDFWRCWSRMLGILAAQDEGERNDEAILVQINRLRLVDPTFGGEPFKRRIESVVRTIKPTGG